MSHGCRALKPRDSISATFSNAAFLKLLIFEVGSFAHEGNRWAGAHGAAILREVFEVLVIKLEAMLVKGGKEIKYSHRSS